MDKNQILLELIKKSSILDEQLKNNFLQGLQYMEQEEIDELIEFLKNSEVELEAIRNKFEDDKQEIIKRYINKIQSDSDNIKKIFIDDMKKISLKSDEEVAEELLKKSKNL